VQPELSEVERGALRDLLARPEPVRHAIEKYSQLRKAQMDSASADCMRNVPRQVEQAADYAAQAGVYGQLLKDLARFADK
jgi:hypothetical protein